MHSVAHILRVCTTIEMGRLGLLYKHMQMLLVSQVKMLPPRIALSSPIKQVHLDGVMTILDGLEGNHILQTHEITK
ncbi:MAG: hypothetical protein J7J04_07645 [Thermococcus sp.]|nr:hypothetical protein [Thermococcus sp.]